jgi:hypothetical protein
MVPRFVNHFRKKEDKHKPKPHRVPHSMAQKKKQPAKPKSKFALSTISTSNDTDLTQDSYYLYPTGASNATTDVELSAASRAIESRGSSEIAVLKTWEVRPVPRDDVVDFEETRPPHFNWTPNLR